MAPSSMNGATVAITGGTGSFGTRMTQHLLDRGVGRIHILSRDEAKQDHMRRTFADDRLRFFLGDVRDLASIERPLAHVDFVFHAAALKQVPSCEFFPEQAVKTNVAGSYNVIEAASRAGVSTVVCLSTDKAVYPVNAMGMTKALMEKTAQAFARNNPKSKTVVTVTRYGNVMYSRGSVIPHFVGQINSGRPMTITEPHMTRFLMSLSESVELVEHAFTHAEPGDLFVKRAPACTVKVLATAVAQILGIDEPAMEIIGTRHGEKLHETLLSREEMTSAQEQAGYFRVPLDVRSLDYQPYFDEGERNVAQTSDYTSENTERLTVEQTVSKLRELPEIADLSIGRAW